MLPTGLTNLDYKVVLVAIYYVDLSTAAFTAAFPWPLF